MSSWMRFVERVDFRAQLLESVGRKSRALPVAGTPPSMAVCRNSGGGLLLDVCAFRAHALDALVLALRMVSTRADRMPENAADATERGFVRGRVEIDERVRYLAARMLRHVGEFDVLPAIALKIWSPMFGMLACGIATRCGAFAAAPSPGRFPTESRSVLQEPRTLSATSRRSSPLLGLESVEARDAAGRSLRI